MADGTPLENVASHRAPAVATKPADPPAIPKWESTALLQGANEALIIHDGQTYRLRLTRLGKLILYK